MVTHDNRGTVGQPSAGRRESDIPTQTIAEELAALRARLERTESRGSSASLKEIAGVVGAVSVITSSVIALVIWLGGGIVGPGARFEEYKRESMRADSLSVLERQALMTSLSELSSTLARFGYDMCVVVHRRPQDVCFDGYLAQINRPAPPRPTLKAP